MFVGRANEIEVLRSGIRERKHLHIYGEAGTGKSALLQWACANWHQMDNSLSPVYCDRSHTLRGIVLQISAFLLRQLGPLQSIDKLGRKSEFRSCDELKKAAIPELKQIVSRNIQKVQCCLLLDHLEHITPRIHSQLTMLYERVPVITSSRQSWDIADYSFLGNLAYHGIYLTPKLRLTNLNRRDAFAVMESLGKRLSLHGGEKESLFEQVFHIARGNPGLMNKIIAKAGRPEYRVDGRINLNLIIIDMNVRDATDK